MNSKKQYRKSLTKNNIVAVANVYEEDEFYDEDISHFHFDIQICRRSTDQ